MSEMVERVAKAIIKARTYRAGTADGDVNAIRLFAEQEARAAIEAMREPTQAMLERGDHGTSASGWANMIDEALK